MMLLTGPCGSGKTAAVYACANELSYGVLEINSSSRRSGKCITDMFREVCQAVFLVSICSFCVWVVFFIPNRVGVVCLCLWYVYIFSRSVEYQL